MEHSMRRKLETRITKLEFHCIIFVQHIYCDISNCAGVTDIAVVRLPV